MWPPVCSVLPATNKQKKLSKKVLKQAYTQLATFIHFCLFVAATTYYEFCLVAAVCCLCKVTLCLYTVCILFLLATFRHYFAFHLSFSFWFFLLKHRLSYYRQLKMTIYHWDSIATTAVAAAAIDTADIHSSPIVQLGKKWPLQPLLCCTALFKLVSFNQNVNAHWPTRAEANTFTRQEKGLSCKSEMLSVVCTGGTIAQIQHYKEGQAEWLVKEKINLIYHHFRWVREEMLAKVLTAVLTTKTSHTEMIIIMRESSCGILMATQLSAILRCCCLYVTSPQAYYRFNWTQVSEPPECLVAASKTDEAKWQSSIGSSGRLAMLVVHCWNCNHEKGPSA